MSFERQMSPTALQIAETKPKFWEYKLTGELIRDWVGPIEQKYNDLRAGLYALPRHVVPGSDFLTWTSNQLGMVSDQTKALSRLVDIELGRSWGPPGAPGSVDEIKRVCSYIADACGRLLGWEEAVRSANTDEAYSEIMSLLPGAVGGNISEVMKITPFIENVVSSGPGSYEFKIIIALPEGWEDQFDAAMERLRDQMDVGDA